MIIYRRIYFITIMVCFTNVKVLFAKKKINHRNISIWNDMFMLNGIPVQIRSGSIHYFRVPAPYWRDRLHKLKAAGLNAVSTYVEWSYHEPEERQYDFIGDRDLVHFIRLAAAERLHVLLRPGPYICAGRDLGGLPYWLLSKHRDIRLRSTDKDFMNETNKWFDKLFEQLNPLLYGNGGPIIMVQVESDDSRLESDRSYMVALRDVLIPYIGKNAILYTAHGSSQDTVRTGIVAGTLRTINSGSEYKSGWLTHWGETFQRVPAKKTIRALRTMLDNNISFNIYMFHGGTNFEFGSGANYQKQYQPDITSYDYDAPLDEAGDPTPKYYEIRQIMEKYFPEVKKKRLPIKSPKHGTMTIALTHKVHLLSSEGRKAFGKVYSHGEHSGTRLPTFESLRQRSGLVLYETRLNANTSKIERLLLSIEKPRDRVYVFIDGEPKGVFSRMQKISDIIININDQNKILSLLVENKGRISCAPEMRDWKGILSPVLLSHHGALNGNWTITGFPLDNIGIVKLGSSQNSSEPGQGPALYEGSFTLTGDTKPLDTFLDTYGWGKGYVWVNGHNLGRYWPSVGPQVTLYVPGAWLLAAPVTNRLHILELESPKPNLNIKFIDHHVLEKNDFK